MQARLAFSLEVQTEYRKEIQLTAQRELEAKNIAQENNAREAQRKQAEAAAAERAYRDSLSTMNPGQLFVKAEELARSGDAAKAREVRAALLSKFPDHALAAQAAAQMASASAASSQGGGGTSQAGESGRNVPETIGDVCNGQVPAFIGQKWTRFSNPELRKMYADTAKPFDQKLREDTRTATKAQVTRQVNELLANWRTQISVSVDNYCKIQAGCNDPKAIERSWPAALASNMPKVNGQSASEVMASQYVIIGFAIDYFSAYEKYLSCSGR